MAVGIKVSAQLLIELDNGMIGNWTNMQEWVRSKAAIKRTSKDEGSKQ